MLPEILGLALAAALSWSASIATPVASVPSWRAVALEFAPAPTFKPADRAVSNWRREAAMNLDLPVATALQLAAGEGIRGVPRCVRLNNYWCIKRAGWSGEIAADAEGHVAFASAAEGATVAAMLLRRYYLDFNRRSAMAIVSRWAPSQCGLLVTAGRRVGHSRRPIATAVSRVLAPRGIGNTLRARWLAARRRGGFRAIAGRNRVLLRRSVIADPGLRLMPAPEIAAGLGEHEIKLQPFALDARTFADAATRPFAGAAPCGGDSQRIRNYARRAIEGVATSPDADLHLFDADGRAGANLPRVLANMANVEIGPLAVRPELIAAGIEQAMRQIRATEAAKATQ